MPDTDDMAGPLRETSGGPAGSGTVLLVASTGGHLAHLLVLEAWWQRLDRAWVTFDKADARSRLQGERVFFAFHPTTRNIPNALRNARLAFRLLRRERPSMIVSTGAGVAIPFFAVATCLRIPTVYIEVYDRVSSRTLSGRVCRHLASSFLVQWPQQAQLYPGSTMIGRLF